MTLPLTVIGGYLGAGKTSAVNHLLRHADGIRLAVLVNEFGALPIDEDLIEAEDEDIISIAGGCVCCSYGNDLTLALMKLAELEPAPDHVLLEASGVAIPGAIAASVSLLQGFALDGILVLVNAETVIEQASDAYIGDTILRQLADADIVVLNKTDLVAEADLGATHGWLQQTVPEASVVPALHGTVPPQIMLQSFLSRDRTLRSAAHSASADFHSEHLAVTGCVDADALALGLAQSDLGIVRAKGFVRTAVEQISTVQTVGRQWSVTATAPSIEPGLVVIGLRGQMDMLGVQALLSACMR